MDESRNGRIAIMIAAETVTDVYVGTYVKTSVVFKNVDDNETDPSVVTVEVTLPDETSTVYTYGTDVELVRDSIGNYWFGMTITMAGRHRFFWTGEGVGVDGAFMLAVDMPDWPMYRMPGGPH